MLISHSWSNGGQILHDPYCTASAQHRLTLPRTSYNKTKWDGIEKTRKYRIREETDLSTPRADHDSSYLLSPGFIQSFK